MKVVAIKDMSAGNESVGTEWQETKIFDGHTPVAEVLQWAGTKTHVAITLPDGEILPPPPEKPQDNLPF